MESFKIVQHPDPILQQRSAEIVDISDEVKGVIEQMIYTLRNSAIGVGLAAPQIGKSMRIVVIEAPEFKDRDEKVVSKAIPLTVLINPNITKFSKETTTEEEGCLSYPYFTGPVERAAKIKFEALTTEGKKIKCSASSLLARIVQHEVDHLDGILFFDRVKPGQLKKSTSDEIKHS